MMQSHDSESISGYCVPEFSEVNSSSPAPCETEGKSVLPGVRCMYMSHALSRWSDRMWEYTATYFMAGIWPSSLVLIAIYGLMEGFAIVTLGVAIGTSVDLYPRMQVVQLALVIQNVAVVLAAFLLAGLLSSSQRTLTLAFSLFIFLLLLVSGMAALAGLASSIAIERDWVVVVANQAGEGNSRQLSHINAVMRQIDLCCKLLAPLAAGLLMSYLSPSLAILIIATWNVLSGTVELYLLYQAFKAVPSLGKPAIRHVRVPHKELLQSSAMSSSTSANEVFQEEGKPFIHTDAETEEPCAALMLPENSWAPIDSYWKHSVEAVHMGVKDMIRGCQLYWQQDVLLAAVALACLYLTVLSFHSLMTAYLVDEGVSPALLGAMRGAAAMTGLAGTLVFPLLQDHLGTLRAGLWSIWSQWAFLLPCVAFLWLPAAGRVYSIMFGVVGSRLGLWSFDLAVTQLMQESVLEGERGVIGGVQEALQKVLEMLTYVLALALSRPQDFWILVIVSMGMVTISAMLYTRHCYVVRGHIFHLELLLWSKR